MNDREEEAKIFRLKHLVNLARARLADLLVEHGTVRGEIEEVLALAFVELGALRQRHELLESRLNLLRWRLNGLTGGDPATEKEFGARWERSEEEVSRRYREARLGLEEKRKKPGGERAERLRRVWKKLVRLCHPDRHHDNPEKHEFYERLMAVINRAKDDVDLETLEKIAKDPEGFARGRGREVGAPGEVPSSGRDWKGRARELRELLASLNEEILKVEAEINELRSGDDYALYELWRTSRSRFNRGIATMRAGLLEEIERMEREVEDLERRIRAVVRGERRCA